MRKMAGKNPVWTVMIVFLCILMVGCGSDKADPTVDGGDPVDGGGGGSDNGLVVDCNDNPQTCVTSADCAPVGCKCYCQSCGDGFSYEDVVNANCVEDWYAQHNCLPPVGCPGVCCPQRVVICENNICKVVDGKI